MIREIVRDVADSYPQMRDLFDVDVVEVSVVIGKPIALMVDTNDLRLCAIMRECTPEYTHGNIVLVTLGE